jgi:hypothetical protein
MWHKPHIDLSREQIKVPKSTSISSALRFSILAVKAGKQGVHAQHHSVVHLEDFPIHLFPFKPLFGTAWASIEKVTDVTRRCFDRASEFRPIR